MRQMMIVVLAVFLAGFTCFYNPASGHADDVATNVEQTPDAQFNLGRKYYLGEIVAQDYAEATKWFRMAAERGHPDAQFYLGVMYDEGKGVLKDYKQAVEWYRKAAEQGNVDAQYNLGLIYVIGQGVPQDDVNAYAWLILAAAQGDEEATKTRDTISNRLSPKQRSRGQALASKLQAKIGNPASQAKVAPADPATVTANVPQQQPPNIPLNP